MLAILVILLGPQIKGGKQKQQRTPEMAFLAGLPNLEQVWLDFVPFEELERLYQENSNFPSFDHPMYEMERQTDEIGLHSKRLNRMIAKKSTGEIIEMLKQLILYPESESNFEVQSLNEQPIATG